MRFEKMLRSLEAESLEDAADELLYRLGFASAENKRRIPAKCVEPDEDAVEPGPGYTEGESESEMKSRVENAEETEDKAGAGERGHMESEEFFSAEENGGKEKDEWLPRHTEPTKEFVFPEYMKSVRYPDAAEGVEQTRTINLNGRPEINAVSPIIRSPGAKEISDYFRRDSRRYDRGFKKY